MTKSTSNNRHYSDFSILRSWVDIWEMYGDNGVKKLPKDSFLIFCMVQVVQKRRLQLAVGLSGFVWLEPVLKFEQKDHFRRHTLPLPCKDRYPPLCKRRKNSSQCGRISLVCRRSSYYIYLPPKNNSIREKMKRHLALPELFLNGTYPLPLFLKQNHTFSVIFVHCTKQCIFESFFT